MAPICPNPKKWNAVSVQLNSYAKSQGLPHPPKPLILAGWNFSSDFEKKIRWQETIDWCELHNCSELIDGISEAEWYRG